MADDKKLTFKRKGGQTKDILRRLFTNKKAVVAVAFLALLVFLVIFANVLIPYSKAIDINPIDRLQSPNSTYWFGTDAYGRDIFARIIYGTRSTLLIAFGATAISAVLGTIIGTTTAYIGGKFDQWAMRILDIWMAVPGFLMTLAIIAGVGVGIGPTLFALAVGGTPGFARILHGQALVIVNQEYMLSVKALGASRKRAIFKHVIPNVISQVLIQATSNVSGNLLLGAGLSFLGLGAQPPAPEWGSMLAQGLPDYMFHSYLVSIPGAAVTLTALATNILGDALRDALDPRLKS